MERFIDGVQVQHVNGRSTAFVDGVQLQFIYTAVYSGFPVDNVSVGATDGKYKILVSTDRKNRTLAARM